MRQFTVPDEQELCTLILVNFILVAAVAEARGRAVFPGNDVLRCVVTSVHRARHVPAEVGEQRRFQLRICTPKQQRVATCDLARLADGLPKERFRFSWASRASKNPLLSLPLVKFPFPVAPPLPVPH